MITRPEKINRVWFRQRFGQNFPDLLSEEQNSFLDSCIDEVYTMFAGVSELWDHLEDNVYIEKTQLCYGLLLAWYIADLFPDFALGVASSGGIPIYSKRIGSTEIRFDKPGKSGSYGESVLEALRSNSFGNKAYLMIRASGKINIFIGK